MIEMSYYRHEDGKCMMVESFDSWKDVALYLNKVINEEEVYFYGVLEEIPNNEDCVE